MRIGKIPVIDASREYVIKIEPRDCTSGTKDPSNCAAAKACKRITGIKAALVYRSRTFLLTERNGKPVYLRFFTPMAIQKELISFDRGGRFSPGQYTIKPMPSCGLLGADQRYRAIKTHRPKPKRRPHHRVEDIREVAQFDRTGRRKAK